jgi:hypothetical protein
LHPISPWKAGLLRRFPAVGALAILTAIAAALVMVIVLVRSDNQPIVNWTVQPQVYLSIASTIANAALHVALGQGAIIAWWVKAMSPDSTVQDLHNTWSFANSIKDAILAGKSFNLAVLACLFVSLVFNKWATPATSFGSDPSKHYTNHNPQNPNSTSIF